MKEVNKVFLDHHMKNWTRYFSMHLNKVFFGKLEGVFVSFFKIFTKNTSFIVSKVISGKAFI